MSRSYFWQNPAEIPAVWHGGMSFHGGLLGVVLAVYLYSRVQGINPLSLGDIAGAAAPSDCSSGGSPISSMRKWWDG